MSKRIEWSVMKTGNHQGLVADQDGKNIAVTYDKCHAPLIAAAPKLLEALQECVEVLEIENRDDYNQEILHQARAAIVEAKA